MNSLSRGGLVLAKSGNFGGTMASGHGTFAFRLFATPALGKQQSWQPKVRQQRWFWAVHAISPEAF
jgi:hypothetical protein